MALLVLSGSTHGYPVELYDSVRAESYAYFGKFFYIFVGDDRDVHVDGKYYVG